MSGLIQAALAVAGSGFAIFPAAANKHPIVRSWRDGATSDHRDVARLFGMPRAALIAVPTGSLSGIDVLDIDPRHGGDVWERDNIRHLTETRIHETPSGGRHYVFRHVDGVRNCQDGRQIGPGVDVRGQGGYAIWPASPGYRVISDATVAEWPDWLLKLAIKRSVRVARAAYTPLKLTDCSHRRYRAYIDKLLANVAGAADGAKHDALLRNARALGGIIEMLDISEAEAHAALISALPDTVQCFKTASRTASDGLKCGLKSSYTLPDRSYANAR